MDYVRLTELCQSRKVWIQTHNFPDPDAVAAAFGLSEFLGHFGITAELCYDGVIDKLSTTKMLSAAGITMKNSRNLADMSEEDMIILVDCQKNTGNTTDLIGDELAVIDHHPVTGTGEYEYEDLRITGACSSLVTEYFQKAGIKPSEAAATLLLYGIRMDTLSFSRGVTPFDIEMFGYLLPLTDQKLLSELETNNMEFQDLHGYGVAINNIRVYGSVGFSHIDFPCPDALTGILSDFLLSLVEVEVVVLYAKRSDGIKLSFRSERPDVHAGVLAEKGLAGLGTGGGHASMAGGFVKNEALPEDENARYEMIQAHFIDVIRSLYPEILGE